MVDAPVAKAAVALAILLIIAGQSRAAAPPAFEAVRDGRGVRLTIAEWYVLRSSLQIFVLLHKMRPSLAMTTMLLCRDCLGPFPVGKTEVDADPVVAAFGGWENASRGSSRFRMLSDIAPGGHARWTKLRGQGGNVNVRLRASISHPLPQ